MLKSIVIAVWSITVTLAIFVLLYDDGQKSPDDAAADVVLVDHRTESISIALFDRGRVVGHFTTRVRFSLPSAVQSSDQVPFDTVVEGSLSDIIFNKSVKQLAQIKENKLQSLATLLTEALTKSDPALAISNIRFENTRLMLKSN